MDEHCSSSVSCYPRLYYEEPIKKRNRSCTSYRMTDRLLYFIHVQASPQWKPHPHPRSQSALPHPRPAILQVPAIRPISGSCGNRHPISPPAQRLYALPKTDNIHHPLPLVLFAVRKTQDMSCRPSPDRDRCRKLSECGCRSPRLACVGRQYHQYPLFRVGGLQNPKTEIGGDTLCHGGGISFLHGTESKESRIPT